jgi:hypothetical protein
VIVNGSLAGTLNGVAAVTLVAAPGAGVSRAIRSCRFVNKDTVNHNVRVRKKVAGTPYEVDCVLGLTPDGKYRPISGSDVLLLTATDQSLEAIMDEAATTTNPTFEVSWYDRS